LACLGLHRVPRGEKDGESFRMSRWNMSFAAAVDVKHIEFAVREFEAQVLLADLYALGAQIVEERTGMPLAVIGNAGYSWFPPGGGPVHDPAPATGRPCDSLLVALDEARQLFGLSSVEIEAHRGADDTTFLLRSLATLERDPAPPTAAVQTSSMAWRRTCSNMAADHPSNQRRALRYGSSAELTGGWHAVLAYNRAR